MTEVVTGKDVQPVSDAIYVMPYLIDNAKGIMIVNKKAATVDITLKGVTGGEATVVEVATSGPNAAEPGFAPQIARTIAADGVLTVGPFAVAVVTSLQV